MRSGIQRILTAHHEAGHIVATIIGPASSRARGRVTSVSIQPDETGCLGLITSIGGDPEFIAYAGPWADGYCEYKLRRDVALDDCISASLWRHPDDTAKCLRIAPCGRMPYQPWNDELKGHWPIIHKVAEMLLDGCIDVAAITQAVGAALRGVQVA